MIGEPAVVVDLPNYKSHRWRTAQKFDIPNRIFADLQLKFAAGYTLHAAALAGELALIIQKCAAMVSQANYGRLRFDRPD